MTTPRISTTALRRGRSGWLIAMLPALLLACNVIHGDPEKTVTVELSGVASDDYLSDICDTLRSLADSDAVTTSAGWSGSSNVKVQLSSVSDVQRFSKQITFGKVTGVEGRTIRVECPPHIDINIPIKLRP